MILRNALIPEIVKKWGEENIYLYGAGKNMEKLLSQHKDDLKFAAVVDSDTEKQKKGCVNIYGKEISIISLEKFIQEKGAQKICLLLTMARFQELYFKLETMAELENVSCYIYSLIRLAEQDERLYPEDYELPKETFLKYGEDKIPKTIHYCWFGKNKIPEQYYQYRESWKKYCPGYEIIEWNEDNYDVSKNAYMYAAYQDKNWAFVSDYARIDVVNQYGGIYLDMDVELLKSLDALLKENAFCGYESFDYANFGLGFGSVKNNPILESLLQYYEQLRWDKGKVACPVYQTEILKQYGMVGNNIFQRLDDMTIYPAVCFCGKSIYTRRIMRRKDTFSIHHYAGSWYKPEEEERVFRELKKRVFL